MDATHYTRSVQEIDVKRVVDATKRDLIKKSRSYSVFFTMSIEFPIIYTGSALVHWAFIGKSSLN